MRKNERMLHTYIRQVWGDQKGVIAMKKRSAVKVVVRMNDFSDIQTVLEKIREIQKANCKVKVELEVDLRNGR